MKSRLGLAGVLLLGALLRFYALPAGLRHAPHPDEAYFVQNTARMVRAGDLDHRFYEYPGLFFYILSPVVALAGARDPAGPDAYLFARRVVALFGVASLWLVYRLGARLASRSVGLTAAAILAVSPVGVQTAHEVRPDVVLESFALLALWALSGLERRRGVLRAGLALGAAMAVKFSGILLVPSYVAAALATPGRRFRRPLAALATAGAVFVLLTPYALIHRAAFVDAAWTQVRHFYPTAHETYLERVAAYAATWVRALGVPGCLLVLAGVGIAIGRWRLWLPLLVFPPTALLVFGTSPLKFDRQLLATLGVLALLAGLAVEWLARRRPGWAGLAVAGTLVVPLSGSLEYLRQLSRPSTRDRTLDWIEASVPEKSRILTTVRTLGVDRTRFEVLRVPGVTRDTMPQVLDFDYVVTTAWDDPVARAPLRLEFVAEPQGRFTGQLILVHSVRKPARPRLVRVPLENARLRASENETLLELIRDGRRDTWWQTEDVGDPSSWLRVDLEREVQLSRVELELGEIHGGGAGAPQLDVSKDGVAWIPVPALRGRPRVRHQVAGNRGPSHVLLFPPVRTRALRFSPPARALDRWRIALLHLYAVPDDARCAQAAPATDLQ